MEEKYRCHLFDMIFSSKEFKSLKAIHRDILAKIGLAQDNLRPEAKILNEAFFTFFKIL